MPRNIQWQRRVGGEVVVVVVVVVVGALALHMFSSLDFAVKSLLSVCKCVSLGLAIN